MQQDGHIIWKHHVGGPITSSAYVEENPVLLQDSDNDHHVAERFFSETNSVTRVPDFTSGF